MTLKVFAALTVKDYCLLGYDAVKFGTILTMLWEESTASILSAVSLL